MKKIYWKSLKSRITGISFPMGGVSFTPSIDERKIAGEVITYLENKGIFYAGFQWEHPKDCYDSAETVRDDLTGFMQKLERNMKLCEHCGIIRESLREFQRTLRDKSLEQKESKTYMNNNEVEEFDKALIRLRILACEQIAFIAVTYELDVYEELDTWMKMSTHFK